MQRDSNREITANERRTFLSKLFTGSLVIGFLGILSVIIAYVFPPERRAFSLGRRRKKVARLGDIKVGRGKQVDFGGQPVWVLHLRSGFVALSAVCTHQGCIINWDEKRLALICPCHAGLFDSNGNVLAGPAQRPLHRLRVEVLNEEVYLAEGEDQS